MRDSRKTAQLQMRLSPQDKRAIQEAARRAGTDVSGYVLGRVLPSAAIQFQSAVEACGGDEPRYGLAELNSLLSTWTAGELQRAIAAPPARTLTPFISNYVAAMVELACERCAVRVPGWARAIEPLPEPVFGSDLLSLRLYLLTRSPAPFRRRNLFIDATLGDQV